MDVVKYLIFKMKCYKNRFLLYLLSYLKLHIISRRYCHNRCVWLNWKLDQTSICLFNVDNGDTRTMCQICSKLTIMSPERHQWCRSGVFIVKLEQTSHIDMLLQLLTLNKRIPAGVSLMIQFVPRLSYDFSIGK